MTPPRLIAFYLPQYHPIPENDRWWGEGFTEWTNVERSTPRFPGHHQPHKPGELGRYDLRDPAVRERQAELARAHGIHGFCYYHYWFGGKLLLERPLEEVSRSGRPDLPFCLCWANENWTRAWDGRDREILMRQEYSPADHRAHFEWLCEKFADPRYITVDGRPLFLVYRIEKIPDCAAVISEWRRMALDRGFPGIYLCGVRNMQYPYTWEETAALGIDALVDFQPNPADVRASHRAGIGGVTRRIAEAATRALLPSRRGVFVYDYRTVVDWMIRRPPLQGNVHPCVFPSWDNSPRRRTNVTVIQNDDPSLYGRWLSHAIGAAMLKPRDERLVFVNAWNEWGEGCHLEPDMRFGRRFLEETRSSVERVEGARQGEP